jgi:anti-sigma factor RsiW
MKRLQGTPAVSDEMLNAYVDGALSSEEASRIAQSAAASPEIANRIAMLHHLKASIAGIAEDVVVSDLGLPPSAAPPLRRARRRVTGMAVLAAVSVAALFTATPVWFGTMTDARIGTTVDHRISGFTAVHDAWTASSESTDGGARVNDWLGDVMRETGLSLVRELALRIDDGRTAMHFAFLGPKGCRLSLFEAAASKEKSAGLDISITGGLLSARWTDTERDYTLVTRNMDHMRFAVIANAVYDATRSRGAVDSQLLADVREARQPCVS